MSPRGRRWWRLAAAIGLAAVLGAGACGVPDETGVVVDGPGGRSGPQTGGTGPLPPPARTEATTARDLVSYFLWAAAGEADGAAARVRTFLAPNAQNRWRPSRQVNIVRLTEEPVITDIGAGNSRVDLRVTHLGVLTGGGWVEPAGMQTTDYRFTVGRVEGAGGLFVIDPPPVLLLQDVALDQYYQQRALYFWDTDRSGLVPDLRYLPLTVPTTQRPTQVLSWLLDGPSPWLSSTVQDFPDGAKLIGNVPDVENGPLQVNLSAAAATGDPAQLRQLVAQIRWSLRPDFDAELELRIDGQVTDVPAGDDYLIDNPAYRLALTPPRFCLFDGAPRQLASTAAQNPAVPTPQVGAGARAVALTRAADGTAVAVTRAQSDDRLRLAVGFDSGGTAPPARDTSLVADTMSRPVWLTSEAHLGLVAANGKIYQFTRDGGVVSEVTMPTRTGAVTAVAVPPDGRRLAFVAGGRLYVAALLRDGSSVTMGTVSPLPTTLRELAGVAWSQQDRLVVAGNRGGRVALYEVTVDGALETPIVTDLGTPTLTQLVAYPDNPINGADAGQVMYEANGRAYELFGTGPEQILATDVGAAQPAAGTTPQNPIAPFFLQ